MTKAIQTLISDEQFYLARNSQSNTSRAYFLGQGRLEKLTRLFSCIFLSLQALRAVMVCLAPCLPSLRVGLIFKELLAECFRVLGYSFRANL